MERALAEDMAIPSCRAVLLAYLSSIIEINSADTTLVSRPAPTEDMAGRALTPEEFARLINAPGRSKPEGAHDHALLRYSPAWGRLMWGNSHRGYRGRQINDCVLWRPAVADKSHEILFRF
jgi:hypothetical protein